MEGFNRAKGKESCGGRNEGQGSKTIFARGDVWDWDKPSILIYSKANLPVFFTGYISRDGATAKSENRGRKTREAMVE